MVPETYIMAYAIPVEYSFEALKIYKDFV